MAKVYVVYFDGGFDGYSQPEAVFSEEEKAVLWVENMLATNGGKGPWYLWGKPKIDEMELDAPLKAGD